MIKVFSGGWRGLGNEDKGLFLMMEFRFREILNRFHGAKLHVFLCIVLHSDKEGRSWPGYDLMERETGYNRSSINKALDELCKLEIESQRVLLRYRQRNEKGMLVGSNHYLIFPTPEEVEQYETPKKREMLDLHNPNLQNPNLEKPNLENATRSINQSLSVNQSLSNKETDAVASAVAAIAEVEMKPERERRTDAQKKGDLLDGMLAYARKPGQENALDLSSYPEDIRKFLTEVYTLWKLVPPTDPSTKGLWIREARAAQGACTEFGLELLHRYYRKWKEAEPRNRLTISRPGSLVNLLTAEAGLARQERDDRNRPVGPASGRDPAATAAFQAKLKAAREKTGVKT